MKCNVGTTDRVLRALAGLAILSLYFALEGTARWFALIGIVPLGTAILGWCPLYLPFGFNTCAPDQRGAR